MRHQDLMRGRNRLERLPQRDLNMERRQLSLPEPLEDTSRAGTVAHDPQALTCPVVHPDRAPLPRIGARRVQTKVLSQRPGEPLFQLFDDAP
jgi:hypothetical protein